MAGSDVYPDAGRLPARPRRVPATVLADLSTLARAEPAPATGAVRVTGISSASDLVEPGDLFAALPGSHAHGSRYLAQAKDRGAVAVLTDAEGAAAAHDAGLPSLISTDPRAVLGQVSARIYGDPSSALQILGVTGTSGKTTTTALVRAGLTAAGKPNGLVGTLGVFVGADAIKTPFTTPEAPQLQALLAVMVERGIETVAMEVSSHALRLGRVDGIAFSVGAFTNLSQDHLDFHTDMPDYFAAKAMLFDGRARHELVVIDDEWGPRLVRPATVTVSIAAGADWYAEHIDVAADGSTGFTVIGPGVRIRTGCRIPGRYNVTNTVLALAILAESGVDPELVAPAVARAQVPGRMQRVDAGQPFLAVVDYSHKPAGVLAALQTLRPLTTGRLIIVLGCGGDRDRGKRAVMGEVAARSADVLLVTDDNPRSEDPAAIRAAVIAGARTVPAVEAAEILDVGDRRSAIELALSRARSGDAVLIAGKGHETGQEVAGVMLPFDDVAVARQTLMELGYPDSSDRSAVGEQA